ncbi:MAG TPA: penicillin acylase family protein [Kofleriaceae bacterium]|nr:penicillin acylase family protein [Kofleriaceae bacterium]
MTQPLRVLGVLGLLACAPRAADRAPAPIPDAVRWAAEAQRVTIVRDDWGIAHVHGQREADAVFGMIYAQAEDDFPRIESNYLDALGRRAEAEGEAAIWQDLRIKLFVDPDELKARYAASPAWLRALMDAWADGLDFYLATHPGVKPRVIARFEPWMALAFTEGSIGGDVERIELGALAAFYGDGSTRPPPAELPAPAPASAAAEAAGVTEPAGSNGFAIAPARSASHHALLLINPHTSFFFRSELQMTSDDGLDAYGAVTWGQFFVYQGFNPRAGWMHTSTGADAVDEYAETIVQRAGKLSYRYGRELRPVIEQAIAVPYRTAAGPAVKRITVYRTHHGPIVRSADNKWIAIRLMQKPIEALSQSYLRTKAHDLAQFRDAMELHANSSNNTIYADAGGHIAYFHPQFVPRRDDRFDWTRPVDGSDPATEWQGVHGVEDSPHAIDPPNGWVMNTNDWPYSAAGPNSPRRDQFPRYMDTHGENPRGLHATRVLEAQRAFTLASLRDAAFDSYLPAFATLIPMLLAAYDAPPAGDPGKAALAEPIAALRGWDDRWAASSVATSLAVYWGQALWPLCTVDTARAGASIWDCLATRTTPAQKLAALTAAVDRLTADFGRWRTPWGEINRFQRLTGDLVQPFDDAAPSLPVPFTSAQWGSLASFGARTYPGTKRMYGTSGNSFVAVVEFGDRVRAMAVTAGGESGHPESPHFNDEAARYAAGELREVYFYPDQLAGHTQRSYHPGS